MSYLFGPFSGHVTALSCLMASGIAVSSGWPVSLTEISSHGSPVDSSASAKQAFSQVIECTNLLLLWTLYFLPFSLLEYPTPTLPPFPDHILHQKAHFLREGFPKAPNDASFPCRYFYNRVYLPFTTLNQITLEKLWHVWFPWGNWNSLKNRGHLYLIHNYISRN